MLAAGSNADWHWRDEQRYFLGMERAQSWDRNNMVIPQGVDRLCDNVLGEEGPQLNPQTPDKGVNKEVKERFYGWADTPALCDFDGVSDFWQMSWLNFRHITVCGDTVTLPLVDGSLQLNEGHRCRTPSNTKQNVVLGVQLSPEGKRQQYWLTKQDVGINARVRLVSDMAKYDAFDADGEPNVFHCMLPRRKSQTRGVSAFALRRRDRHARRHPVRHDGQGEFASAFAIIRELSGDNQVGVPGRGAANDKSQTGERTVNTRADGSRETLENIGPGMDVRGLPGETIKGFAPNIPNAEFFPHVTLILTFIAINLNLPVCVLLLDPSNTNFSGYRGAIDQARQTFRRLQKWYGASWFSPVYRWKLRQFIAEDPALARALEKHGANLFKHAWQSPGWDYIQPLQDAQADVLQVSTSLTSQRRRCAKRNMDWGDLSSEVVNDTRLLMAKAMRTAKQLNDKFGLEGTDRVNWREIITRPLPQGMSIAIATQPQQDNAPAKPEKAAPPRAHPSTHPRKDKRHERDPFEYAAFRRPVRRRMDRRSGRSRKATPTA